MQNNNANQSLIKPPLPAKIPSKKREDSKKINPAVAGFMISKKY